MSIRPAAIPVSTVRDVTRTIRKREAAVADLTAQIARWRLAGMQVPASALPHVTSTLTRLERERDEIVRELGLAERTAASR